MIYRIVQGNSFRLHILVRKMDLSKEFNRLVDFDLTQASDIKVELLCGFGDSVIVPTSVSGIGHNVLVCTIPSVLELGNYDVKVSWRFNDFDMVSVERNIMQIVESNPKTKIPVGVVQGGTVGMFDLRYYMVTENQSVCPFTYSLDDVALSSTPSTLRLGEKYEAVLTPAEGSNIGLVKVIMDGNDITDEVYKDGKIVIPAVSGYVSVMANGDDRLYYFGASAAGDMATFNMADLNRMEGDLANGSVTVTTSADKPYVWIVTRVPLVFTQSGLSAAFNTTKVGDLYFYWSDELKPGDNVFNAKLK